MFFRTTGLDAIAHFLYSKVHQAIRAILDYKALREEEAKKKADHLYSKIKQSEDTEVPTGQNLPNANAVPKNSAHMPINKPHQAKMFLVIMMLMLMVFTEIDNKR